LFLSPHSFRTIPLVVQVPLSIMGSGRGHSPRDSPLKPHLGSGVCGPGVPRREPADGETERHPRRGDPSVRVQGLQPGQSRGT
jgi:hypothetical protein